MKLKTQISTLSILFAKPNTTREEYKKGLAKALELLKSEDSKNNKIMDILNKEVKREQ